jgi:hypothetical protein
MIMSPVRYLLKSFSLAVAPLAMLVNDKFNSVETLTHNQSKIKSVTNDGLLTFFIQYVDCTGQTHNVTYQSNAIAFYYNEAELIDLQESGKLVNLELTSSELFGPHTLINWS